MPTKLDRSWLASILEEAASAAEEDGFTEKLASDLNALADAVRRGEHDAEGA